MDKKQVPFKRFIWELGSNLTTEEVGVINKNQNRMEVFTEEEILDYENKGYNLFLSIPGHLLPKNHIKLYVDTQLKRFIDAVEKYSYTCMVIETSKRDEALYSRLMFQIHGVNETQDSIQLMDAYGSENLASNDFNEYFYQMGRYIFDELSSNKDVKLYDNTTGDIKFIIQYRGEVREIHANKLPCIAYGELRPRICIFIGDTIKLPFRGEVKMAIRDLRIHNKSDNKDYSKGYEEALRDVLGKIEEEI